MEDIDTQIIAAQLITYGQRRTYLSTVDVTASEVAAAVQAYSRINSAGQWIDRTEQVNLNALFDRMSTEELEFRVTKGKTLAFAGRSGVTTGRQLVRSLTLSRRLTGPML